MDIIKQTRFFAQNYPHLQGLRAVPSGLLLLVITVWANLQHGLARDLTFPLMVALACLVLYIVIDQYYNRVYGRVKRIISHTELFLTAIGGIMALAAFIFDTRNILNISLLGLVFAIAFIFTGFWYWRPATILFSINVILAILLALLSLLPLVNGQEWWSLLGFKSLLLAFTFLFGIFCVIGGIIAHIYFIRSLPTAQEAS